MPGEAYVEGNLVVSNGCVSVGSSNSHSTILFEAGTVLELQDGAYVVRTPYGEFPLGARVKGAGSVLRDEGRGWSIASIDDFLVTPLARRCSRDVVRLKHIEPA